MKLLQKLFILLVFAYNPVFSQKRENGIFMKAYQYLKNHDLKDYKNLSIADSVVFIEYSLCFDKLKQNSNYDKNLLDSLDKIDNGRQFKAYFTEIGQIYDNANGILFFSKPYKRTVLAEVFFSSKKISNDYRKLTSFGNSTIYLIYFNRCKKVKKCISIPVDYH